MTCAVLAIALFSAVSTSAQTPRLVKDIRPMDGSSSPSVPTPGETKLYFIADDGTHGQEMWVSDGNAAGTFLLKDIDLGSTWPVKYQAPVAVNDSLYFIRYACCRGESALWRTDGTEASTVIADAYLAEAHYFDGGMISAQGSVYYRTSKLLGAGFGRAMCVGSFPAGWGRCVSSGGGPSPPVSVNGTVYFVTVVPEYQSPTGTLVGYDMTLWRASSAGALAVKVVNFPSSTDTPLTIDPIAVNGRLFFFWSGKPGGTELWTSDGTAEGTVVVKTLSPTLTAGPATLTAAGRYLYFTLADGVAGTELWRSDGTDAGTIRVKDIAPGPASGSPQSPANVNGVLYFTADDGVHGREVWRSDGTEAGTRLVRDIVPGLSSSSPSLLTDVNGALFFAANDGVSGGELWRSDGTEAGTTLVYDLNPGVASAGIGFISGTKRGLFYSGGTSVTGTELWFIPYPSLSVDDVTVFEGDSGQSVARFTVRLSEPIADSVTFQYLSAGGSATAGSDYAPVSGSRTFSPFQTSLAIDVPIFGDTLPESSESFFLNLSPLGSWATLGDGQGRATITNDDTGPALPSLSVVDKAEPEGTSGGRGFLGPGGRGGSLLVTLSAPSMDVVTVDWTWVDGTAVGSHVEAFSPAWDYHFESGTATFAPGITSQSVSVAITADYESEANEAFGLRLSNPKNATLGRSLGSYVLLDDDGASPRRQGTFQKFFAVDALETPMVGDFDGDGRTDILTLTRQNPLAVGDVYVALSEGTRFGASAKWHDWFAISTDERVLIGDFDGDGKDDIATWLATSSRQVYVARSLGSGMTSETSWLGSIGFDLTDELLSGDADGDGRDDLILFARNQGKVYVSRSTGTAFELPRQWHEFFAVSTYERPGVADLDGDGRVDIITFATDSPTAFGDVYVALSDGVRFGDGRNSAKWHDFFAIRSSERVRFGDLNADGRQDFFTFLPDPFGQAYTSLSLGTAMAGSVLWPERVTWGDSDGVFVGDVNGDGKADIIVFAQGEGKVYVSLAP